MRRIISLYLPLLLFFSVLFPTAAGTAQNTASSGPIYIVQEGDSLWDIAYRFHVSQTELAGMNGISDANQISIGQALVIPGLEGITGILTTQNVPYGETLKSLGLRYQISDQALKRLNHITSPNELYMGYSLVIPQQDTPADLGKRVSIRSGESVFEMAILNQANPWSILSMNQQAGSSGLLPGMALRAPGKDNGGAGALPPEIDTVEIAGLTQGETAEIQVGGQANLTLSGRWMDHTLNFSPAEQTGYFALQGVHAMAKPGLYPLSIQGSSADGAAINFSQMVMVKAGDFVYDRSLPVDPATLDPETNRVENELWVDSSSPVSPEKMWDGKMFLPVEPVFAECYSSRFGSRRSYNGGEYLYFHTGLDFCGQVGDPIYAAAAGKVVLVDSLTIRGKATMIDHGQGVYTAYMHQSEILVNDGDHVEQGQLIGRVGNTGRVEGPHLHFEVIVGGIQVDPLVWLSQEFPISLENHSGP
ncbi:MAG: peptidoglycan DD-metalloendopeptidase family protein [Acidobacteriaceae bacterium]